MIDYSKEKAQTAQWKPHSSVVFHTQLEYLAGKFKPLYGKMGIASHGAPYIPVTPSSKSVNG